MYEVTNNDLVMLGLVVMAAVGAAAILFHELRKLTAFRDRCIEVSIKANEQGFTIMSALCRAAGTGSVVRLKHEIDKLEEMFKEPGALTRHLNALFTKQLVKRLGDETTRGEILKAVEAYQSGEIAKENAILQRAEERRKLGEHAALVAGVAGNVADRAGDLVSKVNPLAGAALHAAGTVGQKVAAAAT